MSTAKTIRVIGEAELQVAPDQAVLTVEFHANEKTVSKSKTLIDDQVKAAKAWLTRVGVDVKDVQTDRLTTGPRSHGLSYKSSGDSSGLQRVVCVTVRDLSRYEEALMLLLESGSARVTHVEFQTTAIKYHRTEARTSALVQAREKAQAMAAVMSKKIEDVLSIEERVPGSADARPPIPLGSFFDATPTDFALGSVSVRAVVDVVFSLS